jgi:DNA-binding NarL/FixJ family response regulator
MTTIRSSRGSPSIQLVAEGRSNREIAGELYVTLKAIEGHLPAPTPSSGSTAAAS